MAGGERELRTVHLRAFERACMESMTIMTAYSSYDGIPAIANDRERSPLPLGVLVLTAFE